MSTIPVMSYYPTQNVQKAAPQQPVAKAREAFEGEAEALKKVYDNYMKNLGGFQNINGQMVHVTTVLHTDTKAQTFLFAVENRLRDLGVLPPLEVMQGPRMESAKQLWTNPSSSPYPYYA